MEKEKLVLLQDLLNEFVQSDEHNGISSEADEPIFLVLDELDHLISLQQEIDYILML